MHMFVLKNINISELQKFCVKLFIEEVTISLFVLVIFLSLKFCHENNFANMKRRLKI